jgi:hypothetical protein
MLPTCHCSNYKQMPNEERLLASPPLGIKTRT